MERFVSRHLQRIHRRQAHLVRLWHSFPQRDNARSQRARRHWQRWGLRGLVQLHSAGGGGTAPGHTHQFQHRNGCLYRLQSGQPDQRRNQHERISIHSRRLPMSLTPSHSPALGATFHNYPFTFYFFPPPANDNFTNAAVIPNTYTYTNFTFSQASAAIPIVLFTNTGFTLDATAEPGEQGGNGTSGTPTHTVWYLVRSADQRLFRGYL